MEFPPTRTCLISELNTIDYSYIILGINSGPYVILADMLTLNKLGNKIPVAQGSNYASQSLRSGLKSEE